MKYPDGRKVKETIQKVNNIKYSNRGTNLENDINISNKYYIDKNIAYIYKKPTPIKITKVDYPTKTNKKGVVVIKEAYFEAPSTTDYNGIYKGKYIDFEAKETNNLTSFPIENIHKHQIKHLKNITSCGGIGFIIVRFVRLNKTYILLARDLITFINNNKRSSIPYQYFEDNGYLVSEKYLPRLDYLKIVDKILEVA